MCAVIILLSTGAIAHEAHIIFFFVPLLYGGWRTSMRLRTEGAKPTKIKAFFLFISSSLFKLLLFACTIAYLLASLYFNRMLVFAFLFVIAGITLFYKITKQKWPFFLPFLALFPPVLIISYVTFNHRTLDEHLFIIKNRRVRPVIAYYEGFEGKTLTVPETNYDKDVEEIMFMDTSSDEKFMYALLVRRSRDKAHLFKIPLHGNSKHYQSTILPHPVDFIVHKDKNHRDRIMTLNENGVLTAYDALTFKKLITINTRENGQARKLFDMPFTDTFFVISDAGRMHSLSAKSMETMQSGNVQSFAASAIPNPQKTKIYFSSFFNPSVLIELESDTLNLLRTLTSVPWSSATSFAFCKKRKTFYMMDRLFGNILVVPLFLFDIQDAIPFRKHADLLAYDEKHDILYIASSSTGYMYAFDPKRKKIKKTFFVGKGIRRILVTEKKSLVFVLSHYGIFKILN